MGIRKELIHEAEFGENDELFQFVYDFEPSCPGVGQSMNDPGEPPSGGNATITEIRRLKGTVVLLDSEWLDFGFDEEEIGFLEESIYADHVEGLADAASAAAEDAADARRDERE